jgi:hypothetical protein
MAIIDYLGIEQAIQTIFENDSRTSTINGRASTIVVEDSDFVSEPRCPYIGIFLDSYETTEDTITIGGSTPYLTTLGIDIQIYEFALENLEGARLRDIAFGKVKEVLKDNKTLNGNVLYYKFGDGKFDNMRNEEGIGFFKGISLRIDCEVQE